MQTSQLSSALDGFKQALTVAQRNRALQAAEAQQRELSNAQIAKYDAETQKIFAPLDAAASVGGAIGAARTAGTPFDFNSVDPSAFLNLTPDQRAGALPFLPDDASRALGFLSTGKPIEDTSRFSLADRDARIAQDQQHEIAKIFATPVATSAGAVTTLGFGDPRGKAVYGRDTEATASGRVINDAAAGRPVDPRALAAVLPAQGRANADGSTDFGPFGLGQLQKPVITDLQTDVLAKEKFDKQIAAFENLVSQNPNSIGVVGRLRGASQDVAGVSEQVASAFGFENLQDGVAAMQNDMIAAARASGGEISPEFLTQFDPSISQIDQLANLLAYSAASALAAQSGRGLSNYDVQRFRKIVGDPHDVFATPEKTLTKTKQLRAIVASELGVAREALGAPAATPFDAPAAPTRQGAPAQAPTKVYRYDAAGNLLEQP